MLLAGDMLVSRRSVRTLGSPFSFPLLTYHSFNLPVKLIDKLLVSSSNFIGANGHGLYSRAGGASLYEAMR
jgi:hypothetical protein